MGVVRLDKTDSDDKYVLFRDDFFLYVVHETVAHLMDGGSAGGRP